MTPTIFSHGPSEIPHPWQVSLRTRFILYGALWLCAALALQCFLSPEPATETDLTNIQQRLIWPFYTLHMVVIGLAYAPTWPDPFTKWAPWFAFGSLALHSLVTLTIGKRRIFLALLFVQGGLLTVGVIYFVRQASLPSPS